MELICELLEDLQLLVFILVGAVAVFLQVRLVLLDYASELGMLLEPEDLWSEVLMLAAHGRALVALSVFVVAEEARALLRHNLGLRYVRLLADDQGELRLVAGVAGPVELVLLGRDLWLELDPECLGQLDTREQGIARRLTVLLLRRAFEFQYVLKHDVDRGGRDFVSGLLTVCRTGVNSWRVADLVVGLFERELHLAGASGAAGPRVLCRPSWISWCRIRGLLQIRQYVVCVQLPHLAQSDFDRRRRRDPGGETPGGGRSPETHRVVCLVV